MEQFRKLQNEELHRISTADFKTARKLPVVIILDNIRSQNNVGSVFRTSDAFRVEKLCLCGITAVPPHREIEKAALGATLSVEWQHYEDTLQAVAELKAKGYKVYAVEQVEHSTPLQDFNPQAWEKTAFVFGNEVEGIRQEVVDACDGALEIPQFGTKHSFNISVSIGIVLWQSFQAYLKTGNIDKR